MFFDSHAHYEDRRFDEDRFSLLDSFKNNGIDYVVNIGTNLETSKKSIELAKKYDFVYATAAFYPDEVLNLTEDDMQELENLCQNEKVVAIGEIGLDYHYDDVPKDKQIYWFERQMMLAKKLDLPVAIHMRDSTKDTLDVLKNNKVKSGVMHCFSGSIETAKIVLDLGYYISFSGTVTFKNAKTLTEVAKIVPDDRLLIETDCPYISPEPNRGKRNSSLNLIYTATVLANLRNSSVENIAKITKNNAKSLYNINVIKILFFDKYNTKTGFFYVIKLKTKIY